VTSVTEPTNIAPPAAPVGMPLNNGSVGQTLPHSMSRPTYPSVNSNPAPPVSNADNSFSGPEAYSVPKSNSNMDHYDASMNADSLKDMSRGQIPQPVKSAWTSLAQQNSAAAAAAAAGNVVGQQGGGGVAASMPPANVSRSAALDSFQQFKRQAKEKMDRQKMQQERAKLEREKQLRYDQPDKRPEEDVLDRPRRPVKQEAPPPSLPPKVESIKMSPSTASPADLDKSEREKQRLKEQERRRREARAGQIDMNLQSELLAAFEENVL